MAAPDWHRQGLKNREHGRAFEDALDRSFAYYNEKGFALIHKTPEPMKVIRSMGSGRFLACYIKKAQPDYKGLVKGGRTWIFEAKYTSAERMGQDAVNTEQTEYMSNASALGGRCFVVCGFKTGNVYRVPWSVWENMKIHFGRKYVTEKDIQPYLVKKSWNGLLQILD